jgi:O-antigen ligase
MDSRLRFWIAVPLSAVVAILAGIGIADESYLLSGIALMVVFWLVAEWRGGPRPEAWVLALVLVGYILANRGFAQLSPSQRLPLLPAEMALAVAAGAALVRMALRTASCARRDALNLAIALWVLLGAARLWPDLRAHGAIALRDFAMVYYALFFYIAQAVAEHRASADLLRKAMLLSCAILPFSYFLYTQFTEFFLQHAVFRGVPLVFYKDDLVAAYFFAGFFILLRAEHWLPSWRIALALLSYLSAFTISSSRAAIVGLVLASAWWVIARRWKPLQLQAILIPAGISILLVAAQIRNEPLYHSKAYALYEHVVSMVDFSGTRRYSTEERRYAGDNNRFRLAWWRVVADETWERAPLFGLGFGASLADRFVRTYELEMGDDFTARSPHSIVFTVLGRMGIAGLLAWIGVMCAVAVRTWRAAQAARRESDSQTNLAHWSAIWIILTSACFGVVLEGPMGAVVFWTLLGLANGSRPTVPAAAPEPDALENRHAPAPEPQLAPAGR